MPFLANPIFCPLDTTDADYAASLARALVDHVGGVKIGLEFFYSHGRRGYEAVAASGLPIFLDLKLHDIPNTVAGGFRALMELDPVPVLVTVHTGGGEDMMRAALDALHDHAPKKIGTIALPKGAPFGAVNVEVEGCTLCLACVSACPTGAMIDNQDKPQLRFQEDACVQCGLCQNTCPESVITLEPRISFDDTAKIPVVVKEEEPFLCIRCEKPFGTKSSIEKIVAMLGEKHSMFQDSVATDRIKMCEDCRVIVQFEVKDNPMAGADKPKVRTTEDYLRERDEIEAARRAHKDQDNES